MTVLVEGYVDLAATERERFLELDGVGPATADRLVERYDCVERAADLLLSVPNMHPPEIGKARAETIRDALKAAGYEPLCECSTHEDVRHSQVRDDCLSHCETCETVIYS